MLSVLELIAAIVIAWPSALIAVNAPNNRNGLVTLAAFAGVIIAGLLFWDAASDARAARGVFDSHECGAGSGKWDC